MYIYYALLLGERYLNIITVKTGSGDTDAQDMT